MKKTIFIRSPLENPAINGGDEGGSVSTSNKPRPLGRGSRKLISLAVGLFITSHIFAQDGKRIILLISEQNIEGPQRAWWASEIDLSTTEAAIAKKIIAEGYQILEPAELTKVIRQDRAFRMLNLSEDKSIKLGNRGKADYVVLGKAVASSGGKVPQSNMLSCYANITAKLIRIKDGKIVDYLDATGNSAHMDVITGGREALVSAGENLAMRIIEALNKVK